MKALNPVRMSGAEVLPLIEGGKGVSVTTGSCSGAWAAAGGIGTFSGVNADFYDDDGNVVPQVYQSKTRRERQDELVAFGVKGGIAQARIAHELRGGDGRLHMNILWEMGGAERVLTGILEGARGLIHGVTCVAWRRSPAATASTTTRSFRRRAPSRRYGNAPTTAFPNFWARSFTKTRGGRAATTACPIPKIRTSRNRRCRAYGNCGRRCGRWACRKRRS